MQNNMFAYGFAPFMAAPVQNEYAFSTDPLKGLLPGYAYVPYQRPGKLYCDAEALKYGTAFPALNKPLGVYGREFCMQNNSNDCNCSCK